MTPTSPDSNPAPDNMREWRQHAAELSKGTSNDAIYNMALRNLPDVGAGQKLLEFGSGTGNFIQLLLSRNCPAHLTGTDIMPRPCDLPESVKWVETDLNLPVPLENSSFDIVIALEVIEHLENPRAILREITRVMAPGGCLILTTPNQESLRSLLALVFKGHFVAFTGNNYPAHITALLMQDLKRVLTESGLTIEAWDYTNEGSLPKAPAYKWQQLTFGLLRGRWFSDNILVRARKPL